MPPSLRQLVAVDFTNTINLPLPCVAGNLIVYVTSERGVDMSSAWLPAGFTSPGTGPYSGGGGGYGSTLQGYKFAVGGEQSFVRGNSFSNSGVAAIAEFAGVGAFDQYVEWEAQVPSSNPRSPRIAPPAGRAVLLITTVCMSGGGDPGLNPGAGWTQMAGQFVNPSSSLDYRIVGSTSGSYQDVTTPNGGGTEYGGSIASFLGASPPAAESGSAPRGLSGAPEYVIEFFDSGATFGPNNKIGEVWDARNVGWSRYDRLPGKAFFTLAQTSAILPLLNPLLTHIAIWRITPAGDTLVYRGAYIDSNDTGDDVICDAYDYKALLSISRSGFKVLYPTKKLGSEIVSPEWVLAKGAGSSPLGFVTTGTIEDPLGTDAVTFIKTNAQFGTLDQTRLQLFYDLTEMGRANTVNQVTFDIDLTNTFNFWKNRGTASTLALVLGGNVSDYAYLPGWAHYRNDIATVGVASGGGSSEIVSTNAGEIASKGRRQDVTTLKTLAGIAGGTTEADQQKAALERALKQLVQQQSSLMLRMERGKLEPFVGYDLNDTALVEVNNGIDAISGIRRIVGLRCLFSEAGEDVDVLLAQVAT